MNKCNHCTYTNYREKVLQHENDKHSQYNCMKCLRRIQEIDSLFLHEIGKHNLILCSICGKDFTSTLDPRLALKNHKRAKKGKYHEPRPRIRIEVFDKEFFIETFDPRDGIDGYYD